jgi:hypothetical protein
LFVRADPDGMPDPGVTDGNEGNPDPPEGNPDVVPQPDIDELDDDPSVGLITSEPPEVEVGGGEIRF